MREIGISIEREASGFRGLGASTGRGEAPVESSKSKLQRGWFGCSLAVGPNQSAVHGCVRRTRQVPPSKGERSSGQKRAGGRAGKERKMPYGEVVVEGQGRYWGERLEPFSDAKADVEN
jgi:hypothetical protein